MKNFKYTEYAYCTVEYVLRQKYFVPLSTKYCRERGLIKILFFRKKIKYTESAQCTVK
jgi:hypothetical protein